MSEVHRYRQFSQDNIPLAALQELLAQDGSQFWELLAGVFDSLRQGVIVADSNGRVVVFNQTAEKIMGRQAEEVLGKYSLWDFCESCARPPLFQHSLMQGQSFPEEEVEMAGRVGSIGVRVTPLYDKSGRLIGALARLRSMEELRARQLERRSLVRLASIGRIISAVAHEINNPLQAVRTSLELGLDPRKSPERRQEYLQSADREIMRISRVIGQMRNFYRPNVVERKPTDVNATLHEALGLLDKPIKACGVNVELHLGRKIPAVTLIDYQLEQVILNLILNALETMRDGGNLSILTSVDETSNQVLVTFMDNAAPLDPALAANLFDPFAPNGRGGELALGLSVSREIITEMGGSIEMNTEDGNRLVLRLPY